jgi:hypothetical protein
MPLQDTRNKRRVRSVGGRGSVDAAQLPEAVHPLDIWSEYIYTLRMNEFNN